MDEELNCVPRKNGEPIDINELDDTFKEIIELIEKLKNGEPIHIDIGEFIQKINKIEAELCNVTDVTKLDIVKKLYDNLTIGEFTNPEIEKKRNIIKSFEEEFMKIDTRIYSDINLEQKLELANKYIAQQKLELTNVREDNTKLLENNKKLLQDLKTYTDKYVHEVNILQKQITSCHDEVALYTDLFNKANASVLIENENIKQCKNKLSDTTLTIKQLNDNLIKATTEKQKCNVEQESNKKREQTLNSKIQELQKTNNIIEKNIEGCENDLINFQNAIQQSYSELDRIEKEQAVCHTELEQANENIEGCENDLINFKNAIQLRDSELDRIKKEQAVCHTELEQANENIVVQKNNLDNMEKNLAKTKQRVQGYKTRNHELYKKNINITKDNIECDHMLDKQKKYIDALTKSNFALNKSNNKRGLVIDKCNELNVEHNKLIDDYNDIVLFNDELEKSISKQQIDHHLEVSKCNNELTKLRDKYKNNLDKCNRDLDYAEKRVKELDEQNTTAKNKIYQLLNELDQCKQDIELEKQQREEALTKVQQQLAYAQVRARLLEQLLDTFQKKIIDFYPKQSDKLIQSEKLMKERTLMETIVKEKIQQQLIVKASKKPEGDKYNIIGKLQNEGKNEDNQNKPFAQDIDAQQKDYLKGLEKKYDDILLNVGGAKSARRTFTVPLKKHQRGGDRKKEYLKLLIDVLRLHLSLLRGLLPSLFANIKETVTNEPSIESEYTNAAIKFIAYNIGELNRYDIQLFNFLKQFKLNLEPALIIFFTTTKRDLVPIVNRYIPMHPYAYINIIRLKKLSAYDKFKNNYRLSNNDINILRGKQSLF